MGFPGGSDGKESMPKARDLGSIPGSGRSPGEGNHSLPQSSCLENSMDRGTWQATVHGVSKNETQMSNTHTHSEQLTLHTHVYRNTHTYTQPLPPANGTA